MTLDSNAEDEDDDEQEDEVKEEVAERLVLELLVSPKCPALFSVLSTLKPSVSIEGCVSDCESLEVVSEAYDDPSKSLKPTGCTLREADTEGVDEVTLSFDITSIGRFLWILVVSLFRKIIEKREL